VSHTIFEREFEYSFIQYRATEPEDQTLHRAYVWTDPATLKDDKETVIGACCFRWREWSDAPPGYSLDFVWLHPYQRAKGMLEKAWPYFQKRFEQQFFVQDPLSKGIARFLRKQGHEPRGVPVERAYDSWNPGVVAAAPSSGYVSSNAVSG
jgi:hypothetical protein